MAGLKEKYTKGSIKEIAKKNKCSEAKVQRDIRNLGADRRYEQEYARREIVQKLWNEEKKSVEEIRKDKRVCKVFNAPEGTYRDKKTIYNYIHMTDEELEKKRNPNRQNPEFNKHSPKPKNLVWSSGSTDKCLKDIFEMHIKEDYIDCDLTYSIGNFYKKSGLPEPNNKFDKYPNPKYPDVLPLEEVDNLPDGCFSSIIVDPPFVIREKKEGVSNGKTVDRFGGYKDYNDLIESNRWLIATAGRLLKEEGILVYKIQDTVSSGRQVWTHTKIEQFAADNHLEPVEMYLCDNQSNMSIKEGVQKHARKAFSFIYTFVKVEEKTRRKHERTYKKGLKALEARNYEEAISQFTSSATEGHRESMLALGDIYYWGRGVEVDTHEAIYWLRQAAAKGSVKALQDLGFIYYNMESTPDNDRLAWQYYSDAAMLDRRESFHQGLFFYDKRIGFLWKHFGPYETDIEYLMGGTCYFEDALEHGMSLAGLYLWRIYQKMGDVDMAESYYRIGEKLLKTPYDYNDWASELCVLGEYEKALPYIKKCMDKVGEDKIHPVMLDNYAEILWGLGRLEESAEAFSQCLAKYAVLSERRRVEETKEKIRKKFAEHQTFLGI